MHSEIMRIAELKVPSTGNRRKLFIDVELFKSFELPFNEQLDGGKWLWSELRSNRL